MASLRWTDGREQREVRHVECEGLRAAPLYQALEGRPVIVRLLGETVAGQRPLQPYSQSLCAWPCGLSMGVSGQRSEEGSGMVSGAIEVLGCIQGRCSTVVPGRKEALTCIFETFLNADGRRAWFVDDQLPKELLNLGRNILIAQSV